MVNDFCVGGVGFAQQCVGFVGQCVGFAIVVGCKMVVLYGF